MNIVWSYDTSYILYIYIYISDLYICVYRSGSTVDFICHYWTQYLVYNLNTYLFGYSLHPFIILFRLHPFGPLQVLCG